MVTAITSANAFGEVRLRVGGHVLKYSARSEVALPFGTPVYVTDVLSATSVKVVSTADEPTTPDPTADHPTNTESGVAAAMQRSPVTTREVLKR